MIRLTVLLGLYWGPPMYGNYHRGVILDNSHLSVCMACGRNSVSFSWGSLLAGVTSLSYAGVDIHGFRYM